MPEYEGTERREDIDWHQTKGLSLSIIALLLVNIVSTVWWAATLTNDVEQLKNNANIRVIPKLTERVIRLEAIKDETNRILGKLVTSIDKLDSTVDRIDREQAKREPLVYKRK